MSRHANNPRVTAPDVTDLFARYLDGQIDAQARGLGYPEPGDEAVPHDATPMQPIDPALAWADAVAAGGQGAAWAVPPEWPVLVSQQEPAVALAFALGNFPQLVRNLRPLLAAEPAALRDVPGAAVAVPTLTAWAGQAEDDASRLLSAGVMRLARQFNLAEELLTLEPRGALKAVHANEVAALAWHRGQPDRALALWNTQAESAPVLFNRGMALLFLGRAAESVTSLEAAVGALPETSAWHHLAQLYLTLARSR